MIAIKIKVHIFLLFSLMITMSYGETNPNDLKILNDFKKGLKNPELLKWPDNGNDPCGSPSWNYVYCSKGRVTQIQAKNLGLIGSLPSNFNQLSELQNLGLQRNNLSGMLPSFSGLSNLQFAYLDYNEFDAIPLDFFNGLTNIQILSLEENPLLNATNGWSFPLDLKNSAQLSFLSLANCNLVGTLPDFLGTLSSLSELRLSGNRISGEIPVSFGQSSLEVLWLNDQQGSGMTGSIDVIASMTFLRVVWLHGNKFTGTIPSNIGNITSLQDLNLNGNQLVGLIPNSLANMELKALDLNNNMFMGPIPKFKATKVSYDSNSFCQTKPGLECASDVNVLLDFLHNVNYPSFLITKWVGNDPCGQPWFGLRCNNVKEVSMINLPNQKLNGTLSPSLAMLVSVLEIKLAGNNLNGKVPSNFTELKSLTLLDLSDNNFEPPLPNFHDGVKVITDGNPLFVNQTRTSPVPISSPPPLSGPPSPHIVLPPPSPSPSSGTPHSSSQSSSSDQSRNVESKAQPSNSHRFKTIAMVSGVAAFAVLALLVIFLLICCCMTKKKGSIDDFSSAIVKTRDPSDPNPMVKLAVSDSNTGSLSTTTGTSSLTSGDTGGYHVIDSGNLGISVQVLRKVTNDFASENELGRGGFGTVYKGELDDGTIIAVKRMECGVFSTKGIDEFQAEIDVLSKVRHRHLVSLLGYAIEGNERLLVYEYMPLGALSRHLFHWKNLNLDPLSWPHRLAIALDVARGMEYLHSLARQTFIHRDLKSSNILLGDDIRAKVSDFGLVKLAPDGEKSMATRLAGTFGYVAPEYAVMGKITTKVDVFSYGVVLMELLTGLMALDESRPEENRYLAEWFWQIKSDKEKLMAAIDPALEITKETFESIYTVAELAGHCTAREANHRPDMGYAVKVLSELVEKWRPVDEDFDYSSGVDFGQPLPQLLKIWKEADSKDVSYTSLENSKGSIPNKPPGFAESFASSDAR
ncbi:receptor protein kinase TMK1 [Trifolium repens]|nr:receptor protein kinase TMK1 [Trifolium repens]